MENTFNKLKEIVLDILPDVEEKEITLENSLRNLGANSIDRMEIVVKAFEVFKIKSSPVEVGNAKNIQDLVQFLHNRSE